jgi:hypothetical protein
MGPDAGADRAPLSGWGEEVRDFSIDAGSMDSAVHLAHICDPISRRGQAMLVGMVNLLTILLHS